jgi:serine/threonine protein kinase
MPRSEEERVKYVEGLMTGKVLEGMPHAWRLSLGLASAVAQLHKEGVIHRDIKPGNVYLTAETFEGIAKLGDAGMARLQDASQTSMTQGGTLRYMAPELFPGSTYPLDDKKTDVYCCSCSRELYCAPEKAQKARLN